MIILFIFDGSEDGDQDDDVGRDVAKAKYTKGLGSP